MLPRATCFRWRRGRLFVGVVCVAACLGLLAASKFLSGFREMRGWSSCPVVRPVHTASGVFSGDVIRRYTGLRMYASKLPAGRSAKKQSVGLPMLASSCKQIVVILAGGEPPSAVYELAVAANSSWCMVVVADMGGPEKYDVGIVRDRFVYLTVSYQERLRSVFTVMDFLPWNAVGRKVVGYLYAVMCGADVIYDTDDVHAPLGGRIPFRSEFALDGVWEAGGRRTLDRVPVFNPYPLFGRPSAWPRGYPVGSVLDPVGNWDSVVRPSGSPRRAFAVQQWLVNGSPDVDVLFQMTHKHKFSFLMQNHGMNAVYPPVGVLSPFNSMATTFHKSAFWALLLPVSVERRISDVWRSYVAQPIMWRAHQSVLYAHPSVWCDIGPRGNLIDFYREFQLYSQGEALVRFLSAWKPRAETVPGQLEEVYIDLYERGYVHDTDVELAQMWIRDLLGLGYVFPESHKEFVELDGSGSSEMAEPVGRVAVLISGQARSLLYNQTNLIGLKWVMRVAEDFPSPAEIGTVGASIARNVYGVLERYGFDVFMNVLTRESDCEPRVGDESVCEALRPQNESNSLFCSVEREYAAKLDLSQWPWKNFVYHRRAPYCNGLFQQLVGLLRSNEMRKLHELSTGTRYTHFLRLRPDNVFQHPLPALESLDFGPPGGRRMFVADRGQCCCGNEDWFGIGEISLIDTYFDRVKRIPYYASRKDVWNAEMFLANTLEEEGASIIYHDDRVPGCVLKSPSRKSGSGDPCI